MEKIIKVRLFTWFEENDSLVMPGQKVLTERIAHLGDEVDVTNPAYVKRGEELGAFYTDEEAEQIRNGTYRGYDREALFNRRQGVLPESPIQPVEGEGIQTDSMSSEELGDYIKDNDLTIPQTLALVPPDANSETLTKFLDAEVHATNNKPRTGVESALEKRLADVSAAEAAQEAAAAR